MQQQLGHMDVVNGGQLDSENEDVCAYLEARGQLGGHLEQRGHIETRTALKLRQEAATQGLVGSRQVLQQQQGTKIMQQIDLTLLITRDFWERSSFKRICPSLTHNLIDGFLFANTSLKKG